VLGAGATTGASLPALRPRGVAFLAWLCLSFDERQHPSRGRFAWPVPAADGSL